jgi:hypothetical protein
MLAKHEQFFSETGYEYRSDFGKRDVSVDGGGTKVQYGAATYTQQSRVFSFGRGPPAGFKEITYKELPLTMHNHGANGRMNSIDQRARPDLVKGNRLLRINGQDPDSFSPIDSQVSGWLSFPGGFIERGMTGPMDP